MRLRESLTTLLVVCAVFAVRGDQDDPPAAKGEGKAKAQAPGAKAGATKAERRLKDLEEKKKEFDSARKRAKRIAVGVFDGTISQVKKSAYTPAVKVGMIKDLEEAKQDFINYDRWPQNDDLLPAAFNYASSVNARYIPLLKAYDEVLNAMIKAGDLDAAKKMTTDKEEMEKQMPGRPLFREKTNWHGYRSNGKNSIPVHLHVGKLTDPIFEARVAINPGVSGHDIFDFRGTIEGIALDFQLSRAVRGAVRPIRVQGLLVGDKIIGKISSVDPKTKKPASAWITLKRV